jgi:hypothetical protein
MDQRKLIAAGAVVGSLIVAVGALRTRKPCRTSRRFEPRDLQRSSREMANRSMQ